MLKINYFSTYKKAQRNARANQLVTTKTNATGSPKRKTYNRLREWSMRNYCDVS